MKSSVLLTILLCCLLLGCSPEYSAVYQSVNASSKWDDSERIIVEDLAKGPSLYVVQGNQLYLLIQRTKVDWFFHTVTDYPSWDKAEVNRLLNKNDAIRRMLPADWNNWLPKGYGDECKTETL